MKKISTIVISTMLALCAGQAAAQTAAHAAVQSTMQGMAQAAGQVVAAAASAAQAPTAAPAPAPATAPAPRALEVKDFAAARNFELERSKFHLGAIEKFRKCVEVAKAAPDLAACQAAYRTSLTSNLNTLIKQGKMAAAYGAAPTGGPVNPPAPTK